MKMNLLVALVLSCFCARGYSERQMCESLADEWEPRKQFEELKEVMNEIGSGWTPFNIHKGRSITSIMQRGAKVAVLTKDGRSPTGESLVVGYIYDASHQAKISSGIKGHAMGGQRAPMLDKTITISPSAPRYRTSMANGYPENRSDGWESKPKKLRTIKLENVIDAKLYSPG